MEDARRYIEIYGRCRDQLLEKRTFELFLSILKTLTQVMQFFADSTFSKYILCWRERCHLWANKACEKVQHPLLGGFATNEEVHIRA